MPTHTRAKLNFPWLKLGCRQRRTDAYSSLTGTESVCVGGDVFWLSDNPRIPLSHMADVSPISVSDHSTCPVQTVERSDLCFEKETRLQSLQGLRLGQLRLDFIAVWFPEGYVPSDPRE